MKSGWASSFERFEPGRFVIVEPFALAVHDWSKPRPGEPRMFDQAFLEWFTWVRPGTLALIYVPLSAFFVWRGIVAGLGVAALAGLFVAGLFIWTLIEYLMHRFSFHFTPKGRAGVFFAYMIHGVHHAFPEDSRRWVMPPVVSVPVTLALAFLAYLLIGRLYGPIVAGGAFGYLWYDLAHYAMHRGPMKSRIGAALRSHHLRHHYALPERRFGVSTTFWDHVFRTHH
jgi:sterol desaturase/sphingolipid hydroxylase (fatty acid hydroxylase superfamily)